MPAMNPIWKLIAKLVLTLCIAAHAHSDEFKSLDADINKGILEALEHDTSRTGTEKLFENRCQTIRETVGFEDSVHGQARKYSCDIAGIGITLYAGEDLGHHKPETVAKHFTNYLTNKRGLPAKVFIKHDHTHGTSMAFYINGRTWMYEPVSPLEGIEKLKFLGDEAKLILFTQNRIPEWIYDPEG